MAVQRCGRGSVSRLVLCEPGTVSSLTDEEAAVIEAAFAVDRLFWPPMGMAGVPLSEVHEVVYCLHQAVLRLDQVRATMVTDG
jgi:hypothetical protein